MSGFKVDSSGFQRRVERFKQRLASTSGPAVSAIAADIAADYSASVPVESGELRDGILAAADDVTVEVYGAEVRAVVTVEVDHAEAIEEGTSEQPADLSLAVAGENAKATAPRNRGSDSVYAAVRDAWDGA